MKFLQKPAVALVLAVILVPVSLLANAKVRLTAESNALRESFFENTEAAGKAPAYYVNSRISDAASLATVGSHYEELAEVTETLRLARRELVADFEEEDISAMARANDRLTQAVSLFAQAAETVSFTETDAANYADRINALAGAQQQLDNNTYNRRVEEFTQKIRGNFLAALVGADAPDLFE